MSNKSKRKKSITVDVFTHVDAFVASEGITITDFAERAGFPKGLISKLRQRASLDAMQIGTLIKLAVAMDVDPGVFFEVQS